ncbi:MAG: DUF2079 domain-containing protein [Bdellovibrionia bacterium]
MRFGSFRGLVGLLAIALLGMVSLAWLQYFSFSLPAVDFSIFDQMIPNTARGHFMMSAACGNCDHFGIHSTPILFLFYPFHRLFNHPLFFVTLHAVALWSAAIPLVLLARRMLDRPWHQFGVLLAFFCSPFLIKILDYQFHPEAFYVPLFLWFVYLVETKRWKSLWVVAALILSVKEDGAIYLSAAALGALVTRRMRPLQAIAMIATSVLVFAVNIKWVIPANSLSGQYHLAGTASKYGNTVGAAVLGMLQHWNEVVLDVLKGAWLKKLFHVLFLPLIEPFFLVAVAPFVLIHSIAESRVMSGLATYYSAPYLPWVFAGFVLVLGKKRISQQYRSAIILFAVLTSLPAWYPRHFLCFAELKQRNENFSMLRAQVDPAQSICAQGVIFPHLGYPERAELLSDACITQAMDQYVINPRLDLWPLSPEKVQSMIQNLNADYSYQRSEFGDFILFRKTLK